MLRRTLEVVCSSLWCHICNLVQYVCVFVCPLPQGVHSECGAGHYAAVDHSDCPPLPAAIQGDGLGAYDRESLPPGCE